MKRKILATSWHPGGANAISPVLRQLIEEGKTSLVVIAHQFSEKIFQNWNIPYQTIDVCGIKDVSVESMNQLLEIESPDLVFTGTSGQDDHNREVIEQTITFAARQKSITSLAVLDFWVDYTRRFSDVYEGERFKFLPDRIAIMDQISEEAMLREGFSKERLIVTGNPYFDDLASLRDNFLEEDKKKVKNDLGIDPDSYLVLFASQPIEHHYGEELGYTEKTALKDLIDALEERKNRKEISLLIKVHPRENLHDLEKAVQGYTIPIIIDQPYSTRLAIMSSDVIISPFSTVLIESTYLDKPSFSLQPGLKKEDLLITNQLGVTVPIYKKGEIAFFLDSILFNNDYAKRLALQRKQFQTDGRATERVTKLIYKILSELKES